MQLLSNAHREATINGEPVEKLADVDRPIEYTMGGDDRFNLKTGATAACMASTWGSSATW